MTRFQAFKLWLLCLVVTPVIFIAFSYHVFFGSVSRAKQVAKAYDIYGNNACGGTIGLTVSNQVGNALKAGKPWGVKCAKIIDSIMGENHCIESTSN